MDKIFYFSILVVLLFWAVYPATATIKLEAGGTLKLAGNGSITCVGVNPDSGGGGGGGTSILTASMTSNTAPSPNEVSSTYASGDEWQAYDGDDGTFTDAMTDTSGDLIYNFGAGNSETATLLRIKNYSGAGVKDFVFAGSNDNSSYTTLKTDTALDNTTFQEFTFTNSTAYQYYRLRWTTSYSPATTKIYEVEICG